MRGMRIAPAAILTSALLIGAVGMPAVAGGAEVPRSPAGWLLVASPNQRGAGPGGNQLYYVASPDGTTVWAVGSSGQTLAEFLGPDGWEIVRTPRSAAAGRAPCGPSRERRRATCGRWGIERSTVRRNGR